MASSLELNKLLAGVLTAGIIAVGAAVFSGLLYRADTLEENVYAIDTGEAETETAEAEPEAEEASIEMLLASADPAAGETITRQCAACHVFNEGGENRVGPYLWGVVGRDIASVDGFSYSDALQGKEGEWTFAQLDAFLAAPQDWAPGTSMSYAGLRDAEDRADLIAYMREQSSDPMPLPEPEAEAAEAEPAAEEPAAAEAEAAEAPAEEAEAAEETAEAAGAAVTAAEAAADDAAATTEEAAATVEETAEETVAAAEETAEETTAAVEGATEETAAAAEETVAAVEDTAEETAATAEAATEETAAVAEEAAEETAAAVEETTEETVAAVEETTEETAAAAEETTGEVVEETAEAPAAEATEVAEAATNGAAMSGMVAMVADADPAAGEQNFRQCAACHTVDQGGQNRVGPNLWGVFGADIGTHEGFNYSDALTGLEGIWTVEKLDAYLQNPREYAPGNRMAFAGLRNEEDRAAMIAYLRSLSEDPKPVDIGD